MATRTSESAVLANFHTQKADAVAATDAIDDATLTVDEIADADSSISDARLASIEKSLARHHLCQRYPPVDSATQDEGRVSFEGDTAMGYRATRYGQRAIQKDPTGILADKSKPTASIDVPDL